MIYECGSGRQLTSGALQLLNSYQFKEDKRSIYVNFILQIYNCVPLLYSDYFSCCLFDKESICNTFILKYNEYDGKPFPGDIISVTKINISILNDGKHKLYTCEETKLLEKNKKFLLNPKALKSISSKIKFESKDNTFSSKKKISQEIKKSEEKKEEIDFSRNNDFFEELPDYCNDINNDTNIFNISNIINKSDKKSEQKNKKEIIISPVEKTIKIKPEKKEEISQTQKDAILNSINLFIDDFKDGSIDVDNNRNQKEEPKEIEKENEEPKDYSLLMRRNIKISSPPSQIERIESPTRIKKISEARFKYISEINRILFGFQNMQVDFIFKIKCHVDSFNIGKKNIYLGCPICQKPIKNESKICCNGAQETLLYYFSVRVKDPSGKCVIYFHDKLGREFMGYTPEKFKSILEDETPIGKILFMENKKDFFENEFMIWLEFKDDLNSKTKKFEVVHVERINKKHRYEMLNELKNILV